MIENLKEHDLDGMLERVEALPDQLLEANTLCANIELSEKLLGKEFTSIGLCGMGGSAISGDIVSAYLSRELKVPFAVIRNYDLPAWVGKGTLLFIVSYSGNTEESVSCLNEGIKRNVGIFGISSGGQVMSICNEHGLNHVGIPAGWPPRSAVGYLVTPIMKVLEILGYAVTKASEMVGTTVPLLIKLRDSYLKETDKDEGNELSRIAGLLKNHMLMIYAPPELEPAAKRWMCQMNENGKVLAHWGIIPEMNHNELVGWGGDELANRYAAVFLTHENIEQRIERRIELTCEIIRGRQIPAFILNVPGKNAGEALMAALYLGDICSLYLAGARGMDPSPVKMIDHLKKCLAETD